MSDDNSENTRKLRNRTVSLDETPSTSRARSQKSGQQKLQKIDEESGGSSSKSQNLTSTPKTKDQPKLDSIIRSPSPSIFLPLSQNIDLTQIKSEPIDISDDNSEYSVINKEIRDISIDSSDSESSDDTIRPDSSSEEEENTQIENNIATGQPNNIEQELEEPNNLNPEMATDLTTTQLIDIIPKCSDEKSLEHFITTVEALQPQVGNAGTPIFLVVIKAKIVGKAFNVIKGKTLDTWTNIKAALIAGLEDKTDLATATNKLNRITQKTDESVKDYTERVKDALAALDKVTIRDVPQAARTQVLEINNLTAKNTFEAGLLSPELKTVVVAAQKTTLVESTGFALNQEQTNFPTKKKETSEEKKSPKKSPIKKQITCFNCNKPGHVSTDCWFKKKSQKDDSFKPRGNQYSAGPSRPNNYEPSRPSNYENKNNDSWPRNNNWNKYNANPNDKYKEKRYTRNQNTGNEQNNQNLRAVIEEDWDEITPIGTNTEPSGSGN